MFHNLNRKIKERIAFRNFSIIFTNIQGIIWN